MDDHFFLNIWMVAYEKAIQEYSGRNYAISKKIIDKACCYAVEGWTSYLLDSKLIEKINGKIFSSIDDCINHHIENLMKGGMWTGSDKPTVMQTQDAEHVVLINVPSCKYKDGCKRLLAEEKVRDISKMRCYRLGCFAGAVKKYMRNEMLPYPEKVTYFMIGVDRNLDFFSSECQGLLFINDGVLRKSLLNRYLGKEIVKLEK